MSYPSRMIHQPGHRLSELLDAIKQEFESVTNEASMYRMHKDEFDHKVISQQTVELQQIRQAVYELDMSHRKMKENYEEEILRLKRELEVRGSSSQAASAVQAAQIAQQPRPTANPAPVTNSTSLPTLSHNSGVFGGIQQQQQQQQQLQQQQQQQQQHQAAQAAQHAQQQTPTPHAPTPQQAATGYAGYGYGQSAATTQQTASRGNSPAAPKKVEPEVAPAAPATPVSANPPPTGPNSTSNTTTASNTMTMQRAIELGNNLGDVDVDKVPAEAKKVKDDWFVLYNQKAPKVLDVDVVQTLDHNSVVCCVRFSFDGRYIATGCNRTAQIFDVETGQLICRLQDEGVDRDGDLYIRSVCFSPDGRYLAAGAEDKQIRVWDIQTRTIRYLFSGHEQDIYSLDFSRNGRHIASGSGDRTVRMWDMESGQCILTLSIEDGVTTVAISPDGRYVAAGSLDRTVRVWDTSTGFLVERLEAPDGHKDSVYSVAFTPSGKDLISGSLDKTIKLWELQAPRGIQSTHKGGVCVKTFVGHKDFVLSVASTPDAQWIISGSKDRGVQFWDPHSAQVQLMLQGHKNSVISVAPSPTGGLFATGSGDCRARIWRYFPRQ